MFWGQLIGSRHEDRATHAELETTLVRHPPNDPCWTEHLVQVVYAHSRAKLQVGRVKLLGKLLSIEVKVDWLNRRSAQAFPFNQELPMSTGTQADGADRMAVQRSL
jgi:hypothetical protein